MSNAQHHKHKRKRIYKYKEAYPSKKRSKRLLDLTVTWLGVGMTFATIPQAYIIFANKNADGISTISWAYYVLFYVVLLIYGFVHKETPIIITYIGCVILYSMILIGSIIY